MTTDPVHARARAAAPAALLAAALLSVAGCGEEGPGARASLDPVALTRANANTELFVEFRPLVSGQPSAFAAHLTRLADYSPVGEGTVDVVLSGGGAPDERFRIRAPRAPGIFAPTVVPRAVGERRLRLELEAPGLSSSHDLGAWTVHPDLASARQAPRPPDPGGEIGFLKEQQWTTEFAVAAIAALPLRDSVRAPARLRAAASGDFQLAAPVAGLVRAEGGLPELGSRVTAGQELARLLPRLAVGVDRATLEAELAVARGDATLAQAELERLRGLFAIEAVSRRRLEQAEAEAGAATARLDAARARLAQLGGSGGIVLRAPIAGEIARVHVGNGAAVDEGEPLFHIVDRSEVWLEAQLAEADAARLATPSGASFTLPGGETIDIEPGRNGRLVGVGGVLDPESRSLPVIFALEDPPPGLALNQAVSAQVFTGASREVLAVPASAVIEDGGQRVVYVMRGGESFSRVPVRIGARDGELLEVLEGLAPGERVVTRGAMQVRLAAATPEAMGHGHAH